MEDLRDSIESNDFGVYFPLYRAAQNGDWETVKKFLAVAENHKAKTATISDFGHTILHLALRENGCMSLVEELLTSNSPDSLETKDNDDDTALSYAAIAGNTEAASIMFKKNEKLRLTPNKFHHTPLHLAARYGHEETVNFLYEKAKDKDPSVFTKESGVTLVEFLITSNLYGIALDLLRHHVELEKYDDKRRFLETLAKKPLAFASGNDLGFLQRLIYQWIPIMNDDSTPSQTEEQDVKNNIKSLELAKSTTCTNSGVSNGFGKEVQKVHSISFWNTMKKIVPGINRIHNMKQALEIVSLICWGMTWDQTSSEAILKDPIFIATRLGIAEFVKEIITAYPDSTNFHDDKGRNIFQLAVLHRQEKVFNLIHTMGDKHLVTSHKDNDNNNILHLAGKLRPSSRISGAALQMQLELQWFKAVEKLVHPPLQEERNSKEETPGEVSTGETLKELSTSETLREVFTENLREAVENLVRSSLQEERNSKDPTGKTPREVFTEKHKKLVKEGQEWMKNTAQSYTVVAALITTVVFTAAFTVPGGTNSEGVPNYLDKLSFLIFSIADALALFLSSISVLLFLTIITSRYSEDDFLTSLPRKLIIGLITLFFSMAFTMAAFGAALHIVLVNRLEWDAIPITIPVCVTVFLFVWLQFPLLVGICRSTYGPSIFESEKKQLTWLAKLSSANFRKYCFKN